MANAPAHGLAGVPVVDGMDELAPCVNGQFTIYSRNFDNLRGQPPDI